MARYLLLKISQLIELLEIRHSVFLMGCALSAVGLESPHRVAPVSKAV